MKITKRQLRRIINELGDPALRDQWMDEEPSGMKTEGEWYDDIMNFIDKDMTSRDVDMRDEEAYEVIKALENLRRTLTDEKRGPTR